MSEKIRAMKLLGLTPFHIYPPNFGGAERAWNLLSRLGPIDVIALNWEGYTHSGQIGDVNYQLIAADQAAVDQANKLRASGVKTFDPMPSLTRNNLTTIRKAVDDADPDLVILEHPWLYDLIDGRPYLYDSHNCETVNTGQLFGVGSYDYALVKDLEETVIANAEHMTYCSPADINHMAQLFTRFPSSTLVANGVTIPTEKAHGNTRNLLFVGSAYQPNVNAAQRLINLADQLTGYTIQIAGACTHYLRNTAPNVQLLGQVSDEQLHELYVNAYAFVNLVGEGSGTHLKIGRALAYGVPVLTTSHGKRGYETPITITDQQLPYRLNGLDWETAHRKAMKEAEPLNWDIQAQRMKGAINDIARM